jgi:hypothetical protein
LSGIDLPGEVKSQKLAEFWGFPGRDGDSCGSGMNIPYPDIFLLQSAALAQLCF